MVAGQVGDARSWLDIDGSFAATRPNPQEYINETTFLTSPEFREAQWVVQPEPATGLVLLSDGLQMLALKMPQGEPHTAFFARCCKRWTPPGARSSRTSLAEIPPFAAVAQRAEDDLTLVLAVRQTRKNDGSRRHRVPR